MSSQGKDQLTCSHSTLARLPEEKRKAVVEMNGHGLLIPVLQCNDCDARLYIVDKTLRAKKKTEG